MPYTTPLSPIPSFPAAQGKIANPDGTPTREYVTFLQQLKVWMEAVESALVDVEPP
jgi:hypothetical protein